MSQDASHTTRLETRGHTRNICNRDFEVWQRDYSANLRDGKGQEARQFYLRLHLEYILKGVFLQARI